MSVINRLPFNGAPFRVQPTSAQSENWVSTFTEGHGCHGDAQGALKHRADAMQAVRQRQVGGNGRCCIVPRLCLPVGDLEHDFCPRQPNILTLTQSGTAKYSAMAPPVPRLCLPARDLE